MSSDHAVTVADKAKEVLEAGFGPLFKTYRRQPMLQVMPENLPSLGVFILRERRTPDGDANAGPIKFISDLTLGISMSAQIESDETEAMAWIEDEAASVDDYLFTNPDFVRLFEGVMSMDRLAQYSKMGEVSLAEVRIEITVRFRLVFAPVLVDDFKTLHIETRYPAPTTDPAKVQQVFATIDIPQE